MHKGGHLPASSYRGCLDTAVPGKKCIRGSGDGQAGLTSIMEELQGGKDIWLVSSMLASYLASKLDKQEDLRDGNDKGNRGYRPLKCDL